MGRKKKTEEVEELQELTVAEVAPEVSDDVVAEAPVDEVVEEKPKARRSKKAKVEELVEDIAAEPVVEEPAVIEETPIVAEPIVEEVKEEPVVEVKPAKKVKAEKIEPVVEEKIEVSEPAGNEPFVARVTASMIHSRKGPGLNWHIARDIYKGTVVHIVEVQGNWGRISQNTWVNINYVEKI